ncbi:MAG: NADase-type glycan-binding domain-containing protein, partial [Acidimicrobiia bacterium]
TDLASIGITSGAGEEFDAEPRPRQLRLTFSDGQKEEIALKNNGKFQSFNVRAKGVTSVRMEILSVYPSATGTAASIAEVEFFSKS